MATSPNLTTDVTAKPIFPLSETKRSYNEFNIRSASGARFGWQDGTSKLRSWSLSYACDETDFQSLMTFIDARGGGRDWFYWDRPQSSEVDIKVQIVVGSLRIAWQTPNWREVSFEIEEVVV